MIRVKVSFQQVYIYVEVLAMIFRLLAVTLGALLAIACADKGMTTPTTSQLTNNSVGFLQGTVSIGPICPVESKDHPCSPPPSLYTSHKLVILNNKGEQVTLVAIDGKGNYRTELMPGTYTVDFTPRDIGMPGSFQPPTAEIREGETTVLNIDIDTGIR
jgi:hypothetical protein